MMIRTLYFILFLIVIISPVGYAETNYSKTIELSPLRISFSELQSVLDKGASLISAANGSTPLWREELELKKNELRVKITGHQLNPEGVNVPNNIDSFEYIALTREPSPITRVSMSFSDYKRFMLVEGYSPEQVDAVLSALREDLTKMSTSIGGINHKLYFGALPKFILIIFTLLLGISWFQARSNTILLPISICVVFLTVLFIMPIDDFLAGFSAVKGNASFTVRYGAEISFWGLVFGAVSITLSLIPLLFGKASKSEGSATKNTLKRAHRKRRTL